jgi:hypothetical protein
MLGKKIILTKQQEEYLQNNFHNTKNEELAATVGVSHSWLHRYARKNGLTKSVEFTTRCQLEAAKAAGIHAEICGWPPKGYHIPNSEKYRFKKGVNSLQRLGTEKEKQRIERSAESRRKTLKRERARYVFGLPQKTKLRVHRTDRDKILKRWYLKKRGYIIDENLRIAYWGKHTRRATLLEKRGIKWYDFKPQPIDDLSAENVNKVCKQKTDCKQKQGK